MRIVIEGTLGAGKTTFLTGSSPSDPPGVHHESIADLGYPVFSELIRGTVDARRKKTQNPFDDWDDFFNMALDRAEEQFREGVKHKLAFYDRGAPFLGVMARRYGYVLKPRYHEICSSNRYDSPVFLFLPIETIDYTRPRPGEVRASSFTLEERWAQHQEVLETYEALGYGIELVPVLDADPEACIKKRLDYVREILGI